MKLIELTLHDDRKVFVNPYRVSYVVTVGGNASIPLTRIIMAGSPEPVDVRETAAAVTRMLEGGS